MKPSKVIVANRSEIACRIFQACREMGLRSCRGSERVGGGVDVVAIHRQVAVGGIAGHVDRDVAYVAGGRCPIELVGCRSSLSPGSGVALQGVFDIGQSLVRGTGLRLPQGQQLSQLIRGIDRGGAHYAGVDVGGREDLP